MNAELRNAWMIFCTIASSVVIYLVIAFLLPVEPMPDMPGELGYVFLGLAGLSTVGSLAANSGVFLRMLKGDKQPPRDKMSINSWLVNKIAAFAFAESIGLYGLVYYLMTGDRSYALVLTVWAMLALLLGAPSHPPGPQ